MATKDFHLKPFDEGTLLKLDILSKYLTGWLPVFLQQKTIEHINIFDFQCGPGRDSKGEAGSPLRILNCVQHARPNRFGLTIPIDLYFNDLKSQKVCDLQQELAKFQCNTNVKFHFTTFDFEKCLNSSMTILEKRNSANFLFIDPTGLVRIEYLLDNLSMLLRTDFLIFVPAAYVYRFGSLSEFQHYFPGISFSGELVDAAREICEYMRSKLVAKQQKYYLSQFAIKKKRATMINSLIFGSRNLLGLKKFLDVVWKTSPNGEANYDLCGDTLCSDQCLLPFMANMPKKKDVFITEVKERILARDILTNKDLTIYCLERGFLPKDGKEVLQILKKNNKIKKVPSMSFEHIFHDDTVEQIIFT